jgi:hypothetical protein
MWVTGMCPKSRGKGYGKEKGKESNEEVSYQQWATHPCLKKG